jgi:hypothetical protein
MHVPLVFFGGIDGLPRSITAQEPAGEAASLDGVLFEKHTELAVDPAAMLVTNAAAQNGIPPA